MIFCSVFVYHICACLKRPPTPFFISSELAFLETISFLSVNWQEVVLLRVLIKQHHMEPEPIGITQEKKKINKNILQKYFWWVCILK